MEQTNQYDRQELIREYDFCIKAVDHVRIRPDLYFNPDRIEAILRNRASDLVIALAGVDPKSKEV